MLLSLIGCADTDTDTGGGKDAGENPANAEPVDKSALEDAVKKATDINCSDYLSGDILKNALEDAEEVLSDDSSTAKEVESMTETLEYAMDGLFKHSDFKDPSELPEKSDIPDPFEYIDGGFIDSVEEWSKRAAEISAAYQHYMYGTWRDGSDEDLTYEISKNADGSYALKMDITRISTGATATVTATIMLPDESVKAPGGGAYPVIVGMHAGISEDTALKKGYATATIDFFSYGVASDDTKHTGAFYELYPYGTEPEDQTGVLMAWGWGCSKILDALEAGAGEELNISPTDTIVTGVSRWGKAAIVCGAFDRRFKMVAPSCSGAGGVALYRYTSEGRTYDFSSKGADSAYKYTQNEPIGSLQSSAEQGWFNGMFMKFKKPEQLPLDQHELCSLVADKDRYLFIIGSCIYEDWVNAPAMWYSYLGAKQVFDMLGLSDHIAINIHQQGHAVIAEDVEYMTDYFNNHVYGLESEKNLDDLNTSVFALEENADPDMENFWGLWMNP